VVGGLHDWKNISLKSVAEAILRTYLAKKKLDIGQSAPAGPSSYLTSFSQHLNNFDLLQRPKMSTSRSNTSLFSCIQKQARKGKTNTNGGQAILSL